MKRTWLLFSQAVTVLVAMYFVVATLQPDWLRSQATRSNAGISLLQAPALPAGETAPGSFAPAVILARYHFLLGRHETHRLHFGVF